MARKGWSFGALTDALGTAAFINVGSAPNLIPQLDSNGSLKVSTNTASYTNGIEVTGVENNNIGVYTSYRNVNTQVAYLAGTWYNNLMRLGIVRDTTLSGTLGYSLELNGIKRYQYAAEQNKHAFTGDIHGCSDLVLGTQSNAGYVSGNYTDYFRLHPVNSTMFTLAHTVKAWDFVAGGGINCRNGIDAGANSYALQVYPEAGGWQSWRERNTALQVNVSGVDAAFNGVKFTCVGNRHIGALQGAVTGGQGALRLSVANNASETTFFQIKDGGGLDSFTMAGGRLNVSNGDIDASGSLYVGGGSAQFCTDGNIYGSLWGNTYITTWLNSMFAARDAVDSDRVGGVRWVNQRYHSAGALNSPITGLDGNGDNAYTSDLQYWKNNAGWVTIGFA